MGIQLGELASHKPARPHLVARTLTSSSLRRDLLPWPGLPPTATRSFCWCSVSSQMVVMVSMCCAVPDSRMISSRAPFGMGRLRVVLHNHLQQAAPTRKDLHGLSTVTTRH